MEQTPYTHPSFEANKSCLDHFIREPTAIGWSLRPVDNPAFVFAIRASLMHLRNNIIVSDFEGSKAIARCGCAIVHFSLNLAERVSGKLNL